MRERILISVMLFVLILSVSCCGKSQNDPENESEMENTQSLLTVSTGQDHLYVRDYLRLELRDPILEYQNKLIYAASSGDKIYILSMYVIDEEPENISYQLFLSVYEEGTRTLDFKPFPLDLPGREGWFLHSIAVVKDGELSIRLKKKGDDEAPHCLAVTDLEGNVLSVEEPFPDEASYPWNPKTLNSRKIFYGVDDSLILYQWDNEALEANLFTYDPESGVKEPIGTLRDSGQISAVYGDPKKGIIYYTDSRKRLISWSTADESLSELVSLNEINFPVQPQYTFLMPGAEERLLVCALQRDHLGIYTLSAKQYQPEDEIRMAILKNCNSSALSLAAEYTYTHWSCPITVEQPAGNDQEAFRDRILVELATGNGPDMMWVSTDDVQILSEKGLLMDLTELISEDVMEQLFPCVIQAGTVDGRLVALTPELMVDTLAVSSDVWTADSWELSDLLGLLENERWEYPVEEKFFYITPMRCLKALLPDLPHSPFLDIEQGEAHFDSQKFQKILEICNRYETVHASGSSAVFQTDDAECLTEMRWISDFDQFSSYMAEDGDSFRMTGYPMEGVGHLAYPFYGSYLVVNKETEHTEEIRGYISLLLDHNRQMDDKNVYGISARRDVVRDKMISQDGNLKYFYSAEDGFVYAKDLILKPDGTSYLEEFMEFLESCVAKPRWPAQIEIILEEELTPYFTGDKSMEDAVAVLQNRMQLYLDENGQSQ